MSLVDLILLNSDGETPELETAYDMQEYLMRQDTMSGGETDESNSDNKTNSEEDISRKMVMLQTSAHLMSSSARKAGGKGRRPANKRSLLQMMKRRKISERGFARARLDEAAWRRIQRRGGRCSALVRLTPNNLFLGHTTFSDYSEMLRVFKYYDFPLPNVKASKIAFSSYPGIAGSTDDYYITDAQLRRSDPPLPYGLQGNDEEDDEHE
eukprot:g11811.t1